MDPAKSSEIPDFFERYGWQFERKRSDLYRSGFVGENGHFEIWVRHVEPWVYFTINPFVERPSGREHGSAVLDLLLRANHQLNMAKFAVDGDGDVSLSVELPTEGFGYSQFADALTALSHYADLYQPRFSAVEDDDEGSGEVV